MERKHEWTTLGVWRRKKRVVLVRENKEVSDLGGRKEQRVAERVGWERLWD